MDWQCVIQGKVYRQGKQKERRRLEDLSADERIMLRGWEDVDLIIVAHGRNWRL